MPYATPSTTRCSRATAPLLLALSIVAGNGCAHNQANASRPLEVERVGGLAGFGTAASRVRSRGQVDVSNLSPDDRRAVESLFSHPTATPSRPDEFRYRLTRWTDEGPQTVSVPESQVPAAVRSAVRDELQ
jgi:hypothetical protein